MATNYEQIQTDLAACNITLWEPDSLSTVQLSICRLGCMIAEITDVVARVTAAADALEDIETIATADSGIDDVKFNVSSSQGAFAWNMTPTVSGLINFDLNANSEFFKVYILPSVSELLVPLTTDDGQGGQVALSVNALEQARRYALNSNPTDVVETTVTALGAFKTILEDKKTQLEATYA